EVAAYENRGAPRLEPVEHSPRFVSTGRRLKNDCHLSGSRRRGSAGRRRTSDDPGEEKRGGKEDERRERTEGRGNGDLEEKTNNLPRRSIVDER
ncbi:hypothetical protein K0M31_015374, partial [Melipona bicolor]